MHVLVITRLYPTPSQPYLAAYMPHWLGATAAHADLQLIAPRARFPLDTLIRRGAPPPRESGAAYPIYRPGFLAPPGLLRKSRVTALERSVRPLAEDLHRRRPFDVVLAHFLYPDGAAAARVAARLSLPLVLVAHGSDVNTHAERPDERRHIAAAVAAAEITIAVSGALLTRLRGHGLEPRRAEVLSCGYDAERFAPRDRAAARRRLGLADEPWLVYIGALRDLKRVDVILDAVARLSGVRLAIVGGGPESARLAARCHRLGLSQRVLFAGPQPHDRVPDWMAAAEAVVLASEREGTPNVLIEALGMGIPLVATAVGGIPELVGEVAPLVPVGDAEALAAAIGRVLAAPPSREALWARVAGRTWPEVGARQAELLAEAVAGYHAL